MKEFQDNWQAEQDAQKPTEAPPSIAAPEAITLTKPEDKSPVNTEVAVENPVPPLEEDNIDKLSNAFTSRLQGEGFKNIVDARKLAKETVGSEDQKLIEESIELATVKQARNIVDQGKSPTETYNELVALYNKQPNLSTRTSTSVLQQAYSTPVPLAYVASRLAGIDKNSSVLEPTAGNGALLIEADQSKSYANELNAVRRRNLQKQGFTPTGHDAAMIAQISPNKSAEVIIANPPFGSVKDENGNSKVFEIS
jgi:type I restriction-modification system DNA methylase subunit